jgi:NTE family protein
MEIGINKKEHKHKGQLGGAANASNLKRINLALQGGGSHGAFAWGVLDRLLEDNCIDFDGISATSVGAVNATACLRAGSRRSRGRSACAGGHLAPRCQSCFAQPSTANPV